MVSQIVEGPLRSNQTSLTSTWWAQVGGYLMLQCTAETLDTFGRHRWVVILCTHLNFRQTGYSLIRWRGGVPMYMDILCCISQDTYLLYLMTKWTFSHQMKGDVVMLIFLLTRGIQLSLIRWRSGVPLHNSVRLHLHQHIWGKTFDNIYVTL